MKATANGQAIKIPGGVYRPTVQSEAQRFRALGFSVVPCDGKRAIVSGWNKRCLSASELHEALNGTNLNIAIALNQSDVIDVECDSPEAKANLQKVFGGVIPPTPTWRSKRGRHRFFCRPTGLPKKAVIKIDDVEFRIGSGKGALSVVPPSVHPDGPV